MEERLPKTESDGPISSGHRFLWTYLVIILMALVAGSVYAWQHEKVKDLEKQTVGLNKKISTLRTKSDQLQELNRPSGLSSETNRQQIHRVASAYLNRLKGAPGSDTKKFDSAKETTSIDETGKFAIQIYCGPGECSTMTLKKVGHTWVVLDVGLATQERHNKLIEDYGWPPNFVSPQAQ